MPTRSAEQPDQAPSWFDTNAPTAPATPAAPAPTAGGTPSTAFQQANDPAYVRQKATEALTRRNAAYGTPRPPTEAEIAEAVNYALQPQEYRDGSVRSGWSPYWEDRFGTPGAEGSSGADLGGEATFVRAGTGGGGGGTGGGGGLPPGYQMGTFTGGGQYPLASVMAPGLMQPWTTPFSAPSLDNTNDPGYLARLDLGTQAIQRSQAAKGTLRTGGALKDLTQFGQDYGSSEYDKVYNRALGQYTNAYNIFDRNQSNQYNRLSDVAKIGSSASGQSAAYGSSFGTNAGNLISNSGDVNASTEIARNNNMQPAIGAGTDMANYLAQYYLNRQTPASDPNRQPTAV